MLTILFSVEFRKRTSYFLVSAHEYFGKPINCKIGDKDVQLFAESNCWVNGTFTIKIVPKSESVRPVRPYRMRRETADIFFIFYFPF